MQKDKSGLPRHPVSPAAEASTIPMLSAFTRRPETLHSVLCHLTSDLCFADLVAQRRGCPTQFHPELGRETP